MHVIQEPHDVSPKRRHIFVSMVSGDVVVQLFPEAFDGVVLWGVGRQEVQLNASTELFEGAFGLGRFVDDVVVEYEVNGSGATVGVIENM